ncbi:MAG: ABC transporter permease [Bacilli bacterium]|nr:ABC transporter permease [Bacilli bacterium]
MNYFGNMFSFDTIWSVKDESLPMEERYIRWEWDPYSNMPALVGNGTTHRYLIYFDNQFPFVHQNIFTINLGKSRDYSDRDTVDVIMSRTGNAITEETILPKDIYSENPEKVESNLDFHTVTYSSSITSYTAETYGEGNHYINAERKLDGFTRIGNSFVIGIMATVGAYIIGMPIGIWMARKKDKLPDKIGTAYIVFIISVPSLAYIFMFAALGVNLFGLPYKWALATLPALAFVLPTISLALPSIGGLMRWIRRYMIDQENADYVKFARSQGLTEKEIFTKHIFRNAMIYIVHSIPIDILGCLTGAIITERIYGVPGIGGLLTNAINSYDNGVIIASTVFYTAISIIALLLGDLLLAKYDPRVSFTNERG